MTTSTLSTRLKKAREIRGLSARDLSRRADLNPGHVSVLESRPCTRIRPGTVDALAKALDVDVIWLLFGRGVPPTAAPHARAKRADKRTAPTAPRVAKRRKT